MDNQFLDIRTLNFIVILFSCIYSISLLCYQYTQEKIEGLKTFSISLLLIGLGPFLLGFRGVAPDWLTIVIANTIILIGFLLTLYSISIFRHFPLKLAHSVAFLTPILCGLFYYFTFHEPSIKSRIIYISVYLCIVTLCSGIAMLKGDKQDLKLPVKVMAYSFFFFGIFMGFRAIWSSFSAEELSFMTAGLIHQLTFLFSICLIVALSFSMLWLINGRLVQSINDLSHLDALTGLHNRRAMEKIVPNLVHQAHKQKQAISIIMTDVDQFKVINDRYGHTVGDSVMATIANIFKQHLPESACTLRFGGDEFMIIVLEKAQRAKILAEQIRLAVESEASLQSFEDKITMSFGVSELSESKALQAVLAEADEALYCSKYTGRNQVTLFGTDESVSYKFVPVSSKSA
ncbi:diguanylate cyclase (GGDEF)-like protein [Vibrio sp. ES.051]|uniref:GGDEF domain-containing protein n=1 Tax=Vibrio sp. ES.051 TaxID=1761909 RepID=UPI000BF9985F|nr:GGDEF domain-containing protein [Vibrio sp. ES.051]PFG58519.1 diguanylate cyclase (GGDEF)-like protein [Vibrio sp. ES.051]